jgi:hypothetical protein
VPLRDRHGWHLHHDTAKSWKQLEQTLRYIAKKLRDWYRAASPTKQFFHIEPKFPSEYESDVVVSVGDEGGH